MSWLSKATKAFTKAVSDVGKTITKAVDDTVKTIEKAGSDTWNTIEKAGSDTWNTIEKAASDTWNEAERFGHKTGINTALDKVSGAVVGSVITGVYGAPNAGLIHGWRNGISGMSKRSFDDQRSELWQRSKGELVGALEGGLIGGLATLNPYGAIAGAAIGGIKGAYEYEEERQNLKDEEKEAAEEAEEYNKKQESLQNAQNQMSLLQATPNVSVSQNAYTNAYQRYGSGNARRQGYYYW